MQRITIGIRSHFITRLPEWVLALEMGAEGLQIVPGGTFGSTHAYSVLHKLLNETVFGMIGVVIAASWLIALFFNGTFISFRRISPWIRSLAAFAASLYWFFFTTGMWFGNPAGTGFINHAGYALLAMAYSIITAREIGALDREAQKCQHRRKTPKAG